MHKPVVQTNNLGSLRAHLFKVYFLIQQFYQLVRTYHIANLGAC